MKNKLLHPGQIITLRDYPLYNEHILKIYFRIFYKNQGKILPPCPVIHKSKGIPYTNGKDSKSKAYNTFLENYLEKNPKAEYFLLDGGHKTTAATLAHKLIPVFLIEKNGDFKEARKLVKSGDIFGWYEIGNSIKGALESLAEHHLGTREFLTVEDKAKRMVKNKDVPRYMIKIYKKIK
tara:strand:- start:694 stop:1230 length:537 start_codon:yes stop_codon:yes gene_type:complete